MAEYPQGGGDRAAEELKRVPQSPWNKIQSILSDRRVKRYLILALVLIIFGISAIVTTKLVQRSQDTTLIRYELPQMTVHLNPIQTEMGERKLFTVRLGLYLLYNRNDTRARNLIQDKEVEIESAINNTVASIVDSEEELLDTFMDIEWVYGTVANTEAERSIFQEEEDGLGIRLKNAINYTLGEYEVVEEVHVKKFYIDETR